MQYTLILDCGGHRPSSLHETESSVDRILRSKPPGKTDETPGWSQRSPPFLWSGTVQNTIVPLITPRITWTNSMFYRELQVNTGLIVAHRPMYTMELCCLRSPELQWFDDQSSLSEGHTSVSYSTDDGHRLMARIFGLQLGSRVENAAAGRRRWPALPAIFASKLHHFISAFEERKAFQRSRKEKLQ